MMNANNLPKFALGGALLLAAVIAVAWWFPAEHATAKEIVVYKSPTCGCCTKWADHMRANGFKVTTKEVNDLGAVKVRYGVAQHLSSCHTALIDGYVVEGHVPADVVERMLRERPKIAGIAVPGMPQGSPGMEQGMPPEHYDVVAFDGQGGTTVYIIVTP